MIIYRIAFIAAATFFLTFGLSAEDIDSDSVSKNYELLISQPQSFASDQISKWIAKYNSVYSNLNKDDKLKVNEILYYLNSASSKPDDAYANAILLLDKGSVQYANNYVLMAAHAGSRARNANSVIACIEKSKNLPCDESISKYLAVIYSYTKSESKKLIDKTDLARIKKLVPKILYYEVATFHSTIALYYGEAELAYATLLDLKAYCNVSIGSQEEFYILKSRCESYLGRFNDAIDSASVAYRLNRQSIQAAIQFCKSMCNIGNYEGALILTNSLKSTQGRFLSEYDDEVLYMIRIVSAHAIGTDSDSIKLSIISIPDKLKHVRLAVTAFTKGRLSAAEYAELLLVYNTGKITLTERQILIVTLLRFGQELSQDMKLVDIDKFTRHQDVYCKYSDDLINQLRTASSSRDYRWNLFQFRD